MKQYEKPLLLFPLPVRLVHKLFLTLLLLLTCTLCFAQSKKLVTLGSSTTAGLAASSPDSSWVGRLNQYYKHRLNVLDTTYNLGVSGTTLYMGMPSSFIPPATYPKPDTAHNVTKAITLLSTLTLPSNGVVIVNFPTSGYDNYSMGEILSSLQTIYDSVTKSGHTCYITTTQPRSDGNFAKPAIKRKLADIKDSIINRFGVARTINFWDGLFNPTDTTILAAYAAGDKVHFNNAGHRVLFERVVAKDMFNLLAPGDYRSNVSPTGLWSEAASWQIWNGSSWITATTPPSSSSGTITITEGDSIRVNTATTLDQVVIEKGAVLTFFNLTTPTTFTLNDGADVDIKNNGRLYISANATLTGSGTVTNNSEGFITLRNQGSLATNTLNTGSINITGTGAVQNATLTNNGRVVLAEYTLLLNNATFINNNSFEILFNASSPDTYLASASAASGTFINNPSGVLTKGNATGSFQINSSIAFTNLGTMKGLGEFKILSTSLINAGTLSPGHSPGILTVNPTLVSGKTPVLNMEIRGTDTIAGVNYDQLVFSTINALTTNVSGATLNLTSTDNNAPVGTVYPLLSAPSGTITGTFATINLPSNFGNLTFRGSTVTVEKIALAPLPVLWGSFTARAKDNSTLLNWSTLKERATSHFTVEYSRDGSHYVSLAEVVARGNSDTVAHYTYVHRSPVLSAPNYYRLRQTNLDGKSTYSTVQQVRFNPEELGMVQFSPNPAKGVVLFKVRAEAISIVLSDMSGKVVRSLRLPVGTQQVNLQGLPAGMYQVLIYQNQTVIDTQKLVKQ